MNYTVEEAAIKLNTSKQSIYVKIKLPEFRNKVMKKHGKTYIDDDLLNLIQNSLKLNNVDLNLKNETKTNTVNKELASDVLEPDDDLLNMNKQLIDTLIKQLKEKDNQLQEKDNQLKEQLNVKDKQLAEANERLKQAHKLIENNQVLLKDKPQQNILLLEEHFQDLDTKLEEVKNKMSDRKDQQKQKSFFRKIFKGSD